MTQSTEEHLAKTAQRLGYPLERMPRNVAVIMDGNGRWAQQKQMPRSEGHKQGGKTVEKIALDSVDLGLESLTLYSFSTENWKRPKEEIQTLMFLYRQYLIGIRPMMMKNQVKLVHIGKLDNLPAELIEELQRSIEMTADNTGMILGLALNYSGRAELIDMTKKIAGQCMDGKIAIEDINEDMISANLYAPNVGHPDLLIRTASEMRISNFLLWQISYSEFYVTETLWPDFKKVDMEKAMIAYANRVRRFGDVKQ